MRNYNYFKAVREDLEQLLTDEIDYIFGNCEDLDELSDALYDFAFCSDNVTGNASGSYTYNRIEAKEYVCDNTYLLAEALKEFCVPAEEIGKRLLEEDFEYFDVTIRCYVLGTAISELIAEDTSELIKYLEERKAEAV